ncbi:MAG: DUF5054 domain-containing protein [Eubacterium sp.]|nr:DUF5054 domain-containing protein [Eubacterium sp.]
MKKVYVVSKTHLDLGFTDYAEVIRKKYIDSFIPDAISLSEKAKKAGGSFIWTTGSWILKEALENGTEENKIKLRQALENGRIAPHAMPFTTHTELLDEDTLEYGLSIVDEIDKITGIKTIAAKMTDVPGHTQALIPHLCRHGIKLLHIGVNGASAMPDVPKCFVWKYKNDNIIVIYSGDYGGEYKNEFIDEVLYFDHTLDNHGAAGAEQVMENLASIKEKYPDYEVEAGRLDDYAKALLKVKDKLPVIDAEIGDSWIHGAATDPYKAGALRTLISLKNKWLGEKTLERKSEEYITLCDNILCLAEHTCGMDVKIALGDFEHYLRPDFDRARENDVVSMVEVERIFKGEKDFEEIPHHSENDNQGSYKRIEGSWAEQRKYITSAISKLSAEHKKEAENALKELKPSEPISLDENPLEVNREYESNEDIISINKFAGINRLVLSGREIISSNNNPALTYKLYGAEDYNFWIHNYSRNVKETAVWSISDFCRPLLWKVDKEYKKGLFPYELEKGSVKEENGKLKIIANLKIDDYFYNNAGAPKKAQIVYTINNSKLICELRWLDKCANRLSESLMLHFYPNAENEDISYYKLGNEINPFSVVRNGNRNLSAVQYVDFRNFKIKNCLSPLVSIGKGKILEFDNEFENVKKDGISFVLHDNIWGTNFPLWYEDNAYFKFIIEQKEEFNG